MSEAERYRRRASECNEIAASLVDPQQRAIMMAMARAWTHLAELAVKNDQVVLPEAEEHPASAKLRR
jgi:hypothetical protein